jgi:hypothetical protein
VQNIDELKETISRRIMDNSAKRNYMLKFASALDVSIQTIYNLRDMKVNDIEKLVKACEYLKIEFTLNVKS